MFFLSSNKVSSLLLLCLFLGLQPLFASNNNSSLFSAEKNKNLTEATVSPVRALNAPSNVKVLPSLVGAISISWNAVPSADQYVIEYAGSPTGNFKELAVVNAPALSYRHTGLSYDQTVYYRVKAIDGSTSSAFSATMSGKTFSKGRVFKIMPLGDSNTKGSNSLLSEEPKNEPYLKAYREKLYQLLMGASIPFDFVGSEKSGTASNAFSDYDHAGFGGARVKDIADLLEFGEYDYYESGRMRGPGGGPYLDKFNPDIILLHIGTNWVFNDQTRINELNAILEQVDAYEARANKEVTVVLARIIKRCQDCSDRWSDAATQDEYTRLYNENLWKLAGERMAQGDRLVRVNMETGAGINYSKQGGDIIDYLHLTETGYAKMAQVWFNALKADLTVTPPPLDTKAPETSITAKPDALTNKKTATFSLSSNEQNVTYQLSWNGADFKSTTNPVTFNNLADGTYKVAVRAIDAADNIDVTPATYSWTVDTKAPAAPVVSAPEKDALLNNSRPTFAGTAEAASKVSVSLDGKVIGSATTDTQGKWSFRPEVALTEGKHVITVTATDTAGNTSTTNSGLAFTIDVTPPATPAILAISEDTGSKNNDQVTTDKTLRFSGTADAGSVITLSEVTLGTIGTATANSSGTWIIDNESKTLAEKSYTFNAVAIDKAGNSSRASSNFVVRIDVTAPTGYAIQFNTAKVDLSNMKSVGLQLKNAEAGSTYTYSITSNNGGNAVTGSAVATTAGFTISNLDLSGLKDGTLTASIHLVDIAGNKGEAVTSEVIKVTKDIIAVQELEKIVVPIKTPFSEVPLPAQVEVTYSDNTKETLTVKWQQGTYNGEQPAVYTLKGAFELKPNTSNSGNRMTSVMVEVQPNQAPTAIALSAASFQTDINLEKAIGTLTTTDLDDAIHTYALVDGEGDVDNDLFEIREDKVYLKSTKGLSGKSNFMIRVSSTDSYDNVIEKAFTLNKEPFTGKINLANAFSPDGDGINDTWVLPELRYFDNIEVQIFDRSGIKLFLTNDPEKGWDGRNQKGDIQQGAYFYILNIKDIEYVQKGVVTVIK